MTQHGKPKRALSADVKRQILYVEKCSPSPEWAAEAVGVKLRCWQRWKSGARHPRPRQLARLAAVAGTLRRERRGPAGSLFSVRSLITDEARDTLEVRP